MNTRRHFIKCCSALLGSAAVPGFGALAAGRSASPLGFAAFSSHLKSAFGLVTGAGTVIPVVLTEVEIYQAPHCPDHRSEENFSVCFSAASGDALEQGTYMFRHPVMGDVALFVVPNKSASSGCTDYIATFHGSPVPA